MVFGSVTLKDFLFIPVYLHLLVEILSSQSVISFSFLSLSILHTVVILSGCFGDILFQQDWLCSFIYFLLLTIIFLRISLGLISLSN